MTTWIDTVKSWATDHRFYAGMIAGAIAITLVRKLFT